MTCIVGVVHEGDVYLGGDSAGVAGYDLTIRADAKVFTNGPFVMGFTSSFRMGQLLRYAFQPPDHDPRESAEKYMVLRFIGEVRRCLKEGGWAKRCEEQESGGCFLVGYQGRLFRVDTDYQVGEASDGYDAVGCGESYALGALYATRTMTDARQRLELALSAAEHFSAGVRRPFVIVKGTPGIQVAP